MTIRDRPQAGQAAVESIGVTVVIALLLAAVAAWTLGSIHAPGRPPEVIGRVAEPLSGPSGHQLWETPTLLSRLGLREGRRAAPVGRALRAVGRGIVTGAVVGVQARQQFIAGFSERLRERAVDLIHHPLGDGDPLPDAELLTPRGMGLELVRQAGALWDYAQFLRTLPPRVAIMRASRDAGRVSADAAIQAAQSALRKRLMRGRGVPGPAPRDPPAPRQP